MMASAGELDRQLPGHPGVQAEEAQGQAGPPGAHRAGHPEGQAHGRVHRHRQGDPFGPVDVVGRERAHGQVGTAHLVAGGEQGGGSGRHGQRLVAQLVGGHHQDPHRPSLRRGAGGSCPPTCAARLAGTDDDVEGRLGPAQGELDIRRRRASGEDEPQVAVTLGQGDHRLDRRGC